ncbi:ATP-binding protein [Candidatus Parabeggiatoa sp. HSG14]|uniref:ATP-binding protein n=1 Tax=Candidatus Parabeggiatoa sp. HSG14 TaxID=3055593 RepID=UPI0025A6ACA0|nr:ATP-binding protein [Thiotrichales bacterium HSG14]
MLINSLNRLISKLSGKIPLRIVIIVPFVIQIFAVVGVTGWLSFRNGQKAVDDLSTQLRSEVTTRIHQHLKIHTTMPHKANQINVNAIHLKQLNLKDIKSMERHLWKQIQQFNTVNYVGIGTESAMYVGAQLLDNGSTRVEILDKTTGGHLQIWETDNLENRTKLIKTLPNYDPRNRPWYASAVKAGKPVWSEAYFSSRRSTLSVNQPVYNNFGDIVAAVIADISVLEISQFLRSLKIGQTGQSFIMERSGLLVATSTSETPYRKVGEEFKSSKTQEFKSLENIGLWKSNALGIWNNIEELQLKNPEIQNSAMSNTLNNKTEQFKAIESSDDLTRATAHYLIKHFGDLNTIKSRQNLDFIGNGKRHFFQVIPFEDNWGLDWLIVVVVPETDFMAQIDENMYYTILLCLAALGLTIFVGILTAEWIIQPLLHLNTTAKALARDEWQQMVEVERRDEVGELANSFNQMAKQLQGLFTTLKTKNTELQHLDQLKDEFLANTSHELRTPLNGIIGIAESLIEGATGKLSHKTCTELSMVVASGRRLASLVNDILDFSLQKHKDIELQLKSDVEVRNIVDIVLRFCQPLVNKKDLQLINAIPPHLPLINADENRLEQVLHNLVGNAIKFTEKGVIKISAQIIAHDKLPEISHQSIEKTKPLKQDTDDCLLITVSDTGIGIPADKITQIFESYEQIEGYSEQQHSGTGLGLAVTRQLVTLHGGKIWVESTVGVGSRFIFTLPLNKQLPTTRPQKPDTFVTVSVESQQPYCLTSPIRSEVDISTEKLSPKNEERLITQVDTLANKLQLKSKEKLTNGDVFSAKEGIPLQNLLPLNNDEQKAFTVLIVDDEPVNLHVLTNYLSLHHYTILEASSGSEALSMLEKEIPDLILLDVMMPKMTGYEVTQQIREHWEANELPIVLLTAKNQVSDLVTGLEVGANDYLIKPISKNELLARIKTHLHIKQLKAETLHLAIESERRLTQFLEAVPVGVFVIDSSGHPYYTNQRAQQLLDKTVVSEATVKQVSSVYQIYLAGTEKLYPNERQPSVLALQGKSVTVDDMEIHNSTRKVPIEAWGAPIFDEKGNITYSMMAFQDITERKQAETERERFNQQLIKLNKELEDYSHTLEEKVEERTHKLKNSEAILADAQRMALVGSWVWNIKTGIVLRSAQDYRNFRQKEESSTPTYQTFIERIHPDDKDIIEKMLQRCLSGGQMAEFEFRVMWPDGQIRTMRSQTELEFDESSNPLHMKGFTQDVTERKEAEIKLQEAKQAAEYALQQLQATQQQLVESAKMAELGNLVAGVAHEINTPIGIGVTAASRIDTLTKEVSQLYDQGKMKRKDFEKYLSSAQQGSVLILKNLTRAAELIQSFKQVAVDQSSEQQRTFVVEEYLHEILTTLRPEFKHTEYQVSIVCDSNITLSSYPGVFSQVITNFIMNSLIHGFRDQIEGQITITAQKTEENDNLVLRYSDNGRGISASIINDIFDPFFTTNRQGGGSGLGLHIVYNLVTHKLKGNILCESIEGDGTTFIISIPV